MINLRSRRLLIILAIVGLALNLRPALAALGPLLDTIETAIAYTHTQSSLLTSLPVFVMGLCALGGRHISAALSEAKGVGLGMVLIFVACGCRYGATGSAAFLATAVIAGCGIALVQTMLPSFIKRLFGKDAGRVFGLYTTGIMGGAAIAAATTAGIASQWGWHFALAIWALPALFAILLWQAVVVVDAQSIVSPGNSIKASRHFWKNGRAWQLMIFFGIGTGAYTLVLAWLPPFYTNLGWAPTDAGLLLGGLTLAEVCAGLAVSAWIGRFPDRRLPLIAALSMLVAGLVCLIYAPLPLALLASLLLGVGIGALFPLSLILTLDHIDDPAEAGMLTAFVQGGGYLIASLMPLVAGILRDMFADLTQAWIVMLIGAASMIVLCCRFAPSSYPRIEYGSH